VASPITGVVLDHVAVAVERWPDAWPRYAAELGGTWSSGGLNVGFGPAQLRYANGGRVEILQPWQPEANPFLRRFLDRHGPGPHHLTFKVPDLAHAIAQAHDAGFSPVGVDLESPDWKEAFLHPRQATGIVVQMAQAAYAWESPAPEGFPAAVQAEPASFVRATHAVADLGPALDLFAGLLGGTFGARGTAADGSWEYVELTWPHPPVFRLVAPAGASPAPDLTAWLAGLTGRLHHLAFALPDLGGPAGDDGDTRGDRGTDASTGAGVPVAGVLASDRAAVVVEPEDNLGTRLVLTAPSVAWTPT
jgi:hypothetical protein